MPTIKRTQAELTAAASRGGGGGGGGATPSTPRASGATAAGATATSAASGAAAAANTPLSPVPTLTPQETKTGKKVTNATSFTLAVSRFSMGRETAEGRITKENIKTMAINPLNPTAGFTMPVTVFGRLDGLKNFLTASAQLPGGVAAGRFIVIKGGTLRHDRNGRMVVNVSSSADIELSTAGRMEITPAREIRQAPTSATLVPMTVGVVIAWETHADFKKDMPWDQVPMSSEYGYRMAMTTPTMEEGDYIEVAAKYPLLNADAEDIVGKAVLVMGAYHVNAGLLLPEREMPFHVAELKMGNGFAGPYLVKVGEMLKGNMAKCPNPLDKRRAAIAAAFATKRETLFKPNTTMMSVADALAAAAGMEVAESIM